MNELTKQSFDKAQRSYEAMMPHEDSERAARQTAEQWEYDECDEVADREQESHD